MGAEIIDGKRIASEIENNARNIIIQKKLSPSLVFIVVGDDPATHVYVKKKQDACQRVGIKSEVIELPSEVSESRLIEKIQEQNESDITGIIVQLPLPAHIRKQSVVSAISPRKDVDCLHPENIGKLFYSSDLHTLFWDSE